MGFTYTPQKAVDFVTTYVKDIPVITLDAAVCDSVSSMMYTESYWRWTVTAFTPITLVDGTQDYTLPTNLYRLKEARLVRTDTTPDQFLDALYIKSGLRPDLTKCSPYGIEGITHDLGTNKLRLTTAVAIASGETWQLQGEHQVHPTKIVDTTMDAAFWFPDQYFPVFVEGLKWKLFEYADDARAGNVTIDRYGRRTATGQAGRFFYHLDTMKQAEDYGNGNDTEAPEEPFGVSSRWGASSIYGV